MRSGWHSHHPYGGRVITTVQTVFGRSPLAGSVPISAIPITPMGLWVCRCDVSSAQRGPHRGGRRRWSQLPQSQQRRAQTRGDDAMVMVHARVGMPILGEDARGVVHRERIEVGAGA